MTNILEQNCEFLQDDLFILCNSGESEFISSDCNQQYVFVGVGKFVLFLTLWILRNFLLLKLQQMLVQQQATNLSNLQRSKSNNLIVTWFIFALL